MSVVYAAPMYVVISTLLCSSYFFIEFSKNRGNYSNTEKFILSAWCVVSLIVASFIMGVSSEMMYGMANVTHLLIVILIACITLSVSSGMIYWS